MNLFALQLDIVWEDKQANFRKAEGLLERAAPPPGSLVVFPEMWATGFSFNLAATSQSAAGEDEQILAELARKHRVYVTGGLVSTGPGTQGRSRSQNDSARYLGCSAHHQHAPAILLITVFVRLRERPITKQPRSNVAWTAGNGAGVRASTAPTPFSFRASAPTFTSRRWGHPVSL